MEFYFSDKIDVLGLLLDALLVGLTTTITYYIFSYLPKKRRKALLSNHLKTLKKRLQDDLLDYEFELKTSYHKSLGKPFETYKNPDKKTFHPYVQFSDFNRFISLLTLRFVIAQSFSRTWKIPEIISLVNSMVLDDEKFISLSENITELYHNIEHINVLFGVGEKGVVSRSKISDFFTEKNSLATQYMALERIDKTYEISRKVVSLIDAILKK